MKTPVNIVPVVERAEEAAADEIRQLYVFVQEKYESLPAHEVAKLILVVP